MKDGTYLNREPWRLQRIYGLIPFFRAHIEHKIYDESLKIRGAPNSVNLCTYALAFVVKMLTIKQVNTCIVISFIIVLYKHKARAQISC